MGGRARWRSPPPHPGGSAAARAPPVGGERPAVHQAVAEIERVAEAARERELPLEGPRGLVGEAQLPEDVGQPDQRHALRVVVGEADERAVLGGVVELQYLLGVLARLEEPAGPVTGQRRRAAAYDAEPGLGGGLVGDHLLDDAEG